MSRFTLVTLSIFVFLSGCKKKEAPMVHWSPPAQLKQTEQTHGERIEMLKKRLEASIKDADRQYKEYEKFISLLLNDGIDQGKSIVCCWTRSLALRGAIIPKHDVAAEILQELVKEQKFIRFYAFASGGYTSLIVAVVSTYKQYGHRWYDCGSERGFGQYLHRCEKRFQAVIPGGAEARNNERRTCASLIIGSIRRLKRYEAKIPALEDTASKALAAGFVLNKIRHDLEIDVLDPSTAEDKIKEYQEFLNRAAQDLDGARREMATDPEVTNKEVDDVLKQM